MAKVNSTSTKPTEESNPLFQNLSEELTALKKRVQKLEKLYEETYNEFRYYRAHSNVVTGQQFRPSLLDSPVFNPYAQTQFPGGPFFYPSRDNSNTAKHPETNLQKEDKERIIAILSRIAYYPPELQKLIFVHIESWLLFVTAKEQAPESTVQTLSRHDTVMSIYNKAYEHLSKSIDRSF